MQIAGLKIKIDPTAYRIFFVLMMIPVLVIVGYRAMFRASGLDARTFINALLVGVCFAVYHEFAQFVHQVGHALAAHATGYPMTGIRYEWGFTYSEYPPNEPSLPDNIHIQRSLGGVGGITVLLVIIALLWLQADVTMSEFTRWLLDFLIFDSLLLFVASAVLSDGLLFIINQDWKKTQAST